MIITVTSFKGGVGKTTTAIHLAACLQECGPTVLVDGDLNNSVSAWGESGKLPFTVCTHREAGRVVPNFEHVVVDTAARPSPGELKILATQCDMLVIPTTPDRLSLQALLQTIEALRELSAEHYKILLTRTPPPPRNDGQEAKKLLKDMKLPVFMNMIREYAVFQKAALQGVLAKDARDDRGRRDSKALIGWEDYAFVAKEILRNGKQVHISQRHQGSKAANG